MREGDLILEFINDSPSFTQGWECGTIWQRMMNGEDILNEYVHTANKAMLERISVKLGYQYSIDEVDETWTLMTATLDIMDKING